MASIRPTPAAKGRESAAVGRAVARAIGALVAVASVAGVLFLLVLFLTYSSWKAAVAAEVLAVGATAYLWKRSAVESWLRYVAIAAVLLTAFATAVFLRSTWVEQADHDARLAAMVADLCDLDLPGSANVEDCGGTITNTGNGNSCRYLATATVAGNWESDSIVAALQDQGFASTELDIWDTPVKEGRAYLVEGEAVRLFFQSSNQEAEGDLRCT